MIRALACALVGLLAANVAAAQPRPRVTAVLTATGDVHEAAALGERLLLATSGGLVVLDGERVERVLTSRDGLPGTRLRSVSVLADGAVWVGGVEGTAELVVDTAGHLVVARTLPLRRVRRVVRFADETWLATYGAGLFHLDDEGRPVNHSLGRSHARRRLTDAVVVGDELWVGTASAGLLRVDGRGHLSARINASRGLPDDIVWDLEVHGDDVYVATAMGLAVVRDLAVLSTHVATRAAGHLSIRDLRAVALVGDTLYVGSYGGGVHRLEGARFVPASRPADRALAPRVNRLAVHRRALVVAHATGAHRLAGRRLELLLGGGLPSADVTALARAFGAVWVGTFGHGLARLEGRRVRSVPEATERWGVDARINDLAVTGRGREQRLWIATDRGLFWHDGRRFVPVDDGRGPGQNHVTSLHVAPGGDLWVTSSRLLCRLRGDEWSSWGGDERFPVPQLHAVVTDRDGTVWVGSLHGLFRLDPDGGTLERHTVSSGDLPVDWVTALARVDGGIVAGTYHGGLSWRVDGTFEIERERPGGLPAGWVNPHAIRRIDGELWLGTLERGLVVGTRGRWTHLRTRDGLPSDDVTDVLADGDGAAWVATRGGIARVTY